MKLNQIASLLLTSAIIGVDASYIYKEFKGFYWPSVPNTWKWLPGTKTLTDLEECHNLCEAQAANFCVYAEDITCSDGKFRCSYYLDPAKFFDPVAGTAKDGCAANVYELTCSG